MKPIVRPNKPSGAGTRVLLVRPAGMKSVRASDQGTGLGVKLAIGVIAALGVVAAVWLLGFLGYRLGYAPLIDVPDLQLPFGSGLVTGTMMVISIPQVIVLAGVAKPMWLMLGFVMIAIPAAGLGAARPRTPGGPKLSPLAQGFTYAGAVGSALAALGLICWTASAARRAGLAQLRVDPHDVDVWQANLTTSAGLDVLAVIVAALWVVLVLRLATPVWLRALTATASLFTLVVVSVAMAMSNAAVAELSKSRSEVFLEDGSLDTRLLLGSTPDHLVTMRIHQGIAVVELTTPPGTLTVIGRQSVISLLRREASRGTEG